MRNIIITVIALVLVGCGNRTAKPTREASSPQVEAVAHTASQLASEGKLEQAEDAYRQALASCGNDEISGARCREALAGVLVQSGRLLEAERLLREAVAMHEHTQGSTHDETLLSCAMLAEVLRAAGKFPEAESLYRRVVKTWETQPAPDQLAAALTGLAATLSKERENESQELFARASSILAERHGENCVELVAVLDQQALLAADRKEWPQAITAKTRVLEILKLTGGTDRREYVVALNDAIALHAEAGDWNKAIELNRTAIAILERTMAANDPNLAIALHNCALLLRQNGNTAEADELAKRAEGLSRRE